MTSNSEAQWRVDNWEYYYPLQGKTSEVWHKEDVHPGGTQPILKGVVAVTSRCADGVIDRLCRFEMYYLLDDNEVWLAHRESSPLDGDKVENLLLTGVSVREAMRSMYGEPIARRPCPDTPQELFEWARMAAAIAS